MYADLNLEQSRQSEEQVFTDKLNKKQLKLKEISATLDKLEALPKKVLENLEQLTEAAITSL